jgi:hypothetical protein
MRRFLNIQYNNTTAEIDTNDMERFVQVQEKVLVAFKEITVGYPRVQLWNKNDSPHTQFDDFDDIKALPEEYYWKSKKLGSLFLTVQLLPSPPLTASVDSPLIGQVLSVSINQSKLMKKYLTPVGSSPTTPVENSPTHIDLSTLGLQLEQLMFCKNATARPCVVVDVQRDYDSTVTEIVPSFTIVLITGFDGKPLNEVMAEEELKRVIPIFPTATHPGTGTAINTIPEWMPHPKRKIPSYVLCIPIKVYAQNLRRFDEPLGLDPQNLEKLKLHILFLGEIVANADFVDLEEEWDDDQDDLEVNYEDLNRKVTWDEVAV